MPWDDSDSPTWGEETPSHSFPGPTQQGEPAGGLGASEDTSAWARSGETSTPWHAPSQHLGSIGSGYPHSSTSDWTGTGTTQDWPNPDQDSPPSAAALASSGRTSPPVHLLLAGLAAVAVAAGLWFVGDWQVNLLGWAIAAFLGLGSAFFFLSSDVQAQRNPWYIGNPSVVRPLQAAVIVGAIVVAAVHAWSFADWISRQDLLS